MANPTGSSLGASFGPIFRPEASDGAPAWTCCQVPHPSRVVPSDSIRQRSSPRPRSHDGRERVTSYSYSTSGRSPICVPAVAPARAQTPALARPGPSEQPRFETGVTEAASQQNGDAHPRADRPHGALTNGTTRASACGSLRVCPPPIDLRPALPGWPRHSPCYLNFRSGARSPAPLPPHQLLVKGSPLP